MQIRIKQYQFEIEEPFAEGHKLTKGEAQALNVLRAENLRNSATKQLELLGFGRDLLPAGDLEAFRQKVRELDQAYRFKSYEKVGKPRPGPLEAEELEVAKEQLELRARAEGREISEEELEKKALEWKSLPSVQAEARRRLEQKNKVLADSLKDL